MAIYTVDCPGSEAPEQIESAAAYDAALEYFSECEWIYPNDEVRITVQGPSIEDEEDFYFNTGDFINEAKKEKEEADKYFSQFLF